ncbi:hypothetical protein [Photobacterium kishitanii]|uniref:Uncharacterized protein n=1 Tax=Photobacterium kishitanii TaxID=318456 RepID=A0A2T3KL37_9GAMM|nr:hypothetical protein [Photobacterium kishitanii]PSV00422.1 hypothetical protein C9J27_04640 [Photobacterium kishitanii]
MCKEQFRIVLIHQYRDSHKKICESSDGNFAPELNVGEILIDTLPEKGKEFTHDNHVYKCLQCRTKADNHLKDFDATVIAVFVKNDYSSNK